MDFNWIQFTARDLAHTVLADWHSGYIICDADFVNLNIFYSTAAFILAAAEQNVHAKKAVCKRLVQYTTGVTISATNCVQIIQNQLHPKNFTSFAVYLFLIAGLRQQQVEKITV